MEDPLADAVYMRAHQRRANYDIWQDDQLLLKFAVHYLEDFDARLERFRSKLVVPRVSTGWYETSVKRMVEIRARAVAILARQKSPVVVDKERKSQTSFLGGCCKVSGSRSSSVRQSVAGATATATATEDCDESACEEEEEEEEWEDGDPSEEDDTDEESGDDSSDSDYHSY